MRKSTVYLICLIASFFIFTGCECAHIDVTDASCTDDGICKVCGEVVVESTGHNISGLTCEQDEKCIVCGKIFEEAKGHDYSEPTCTEPSTCFVCGKTVGTASGHEVEDWVVIKESTCSEVGEKTGFCSKCSSEVTEEIKTIPHTAGEWQIIKEATWQKEGIMILYCSVCDRKIEQKNYSLSDDDIKASCNSYKYEEIARYPEKHNGNLAKFKGEVVQVISEGNRYILRVNVTYNSTIGWYEDTIYVTYTAPDGSWRILEDDIIVLYGVLTGEKTYETIFGSSVTIPSMKALYIELE